MIPQSTLARVCLLLNERDAHYVLVGGLAVQLWGSARATRDIDLLIEATVENAGRVLDAIVQFSGSWGLARHLLAEDVAKRPVTVIGPTFRTSATRYRAKDAVRFAQRELLHLTHQALELLVVTEPVLA